MSPGAWGERLQEAWQEIRLNPGRSTLQALGVVLGVAAVLAGFGITDSMRRQSEQAWARMGGLDRLAVWPDAAAPAGRLSALGHANLGLRTADAAGGAALDPDAVAAVSVHRAAQALVRSPRAAQERHVIGAGADYLAMEGYSVAQGRGFSVLEQEAGAPVALLGVEAAATFFPDGRAVGGRLVLAGVPVTVVGVLGERVLRFGADQPNLAAWMNRTIALPLAFVQKRLQGDPHQRVDEIAFRIPRIDGIQAFGRSLAALLQSHHRGQKDFRMRDVAALARRQESQGRVYDLVFLLSGILALVGGGMVNVNIQLASLRERVREVGLKMAIGASGREVFTGFMVEAMLLTALGAAVGLAGGIAATWGITRVLESPMVLRPASFLYAAALAAATGFGFALYPAWKASRLSPMEALRYE